MPRFGARQYPIPRGHLVRAGVLSSRLAERADRAWTSHEPALQRVTLHECRHTYASFLMAAGYTLREIMEDLGHSSLTATERYVKLLPQPEERTPRPTGSTTTSLAT